jgi:signal peptidase I
MATEAAVLRTGARRRGLARRWANHAGRALLAALALCLGTMIFLLSTSSRALIVRSGSMEPTIMTGDLIVTKVVEPAQAEVGDVITFEDPTRKGAVVSHRAVRIKRYGGRFDFVTRGDANSGVERWSIAADGTLGVFQARIPKAGYALGWTQAPRVRAAMFVSACLIIAVVALRRIWSSGGGGTADLGASEEAEVEAEPSPADDLGVAEAPIERARQALKWSRARVVGAGLVLGACLTLAVVALRRIRSS